MPALHWSALSADEGLIAARGGRVATSGLCSRLPTRLKPTAHQIPCMISREGQGDLRRQHGTTQGHPPRSRTTKPTPAARSGAASGRLRPTTTLCPPAPWRTGCALHGLRAMEATPGSPRLGSRVRQPARVEGCRWSKRAPPSPLLSAPAQRRTRLRLLFVWRAG